MPGKDNEYQKRNDQPEANKASKQQVHVDYNEDMGEIDPEYRNEADKALRKDVGSNKHGDYAKTNSDSGGKRRD